MPLSLKLYDGKYKRITDPQPRGADCKSAPAAWSKVVVYPEERGQNFNRPEILNNLDQIVNSLKLNF
jgi:hypothetical protein